MRTRAGHVNNRNSVIHFAGTLANVARLLAASVICTTERSPPLNDLRKIAFLDAADRVRIGRISPTRQFLAGEPWHPSIFEDYGVWFRPELSSCTAERGGRRKASNRALTTA